MVAHVVTPLTHKTAKKQSFGNEGRFHPLFVASLQGGKQQYRQLLKEITGLATHYVKKKTGGHDNADEVVQEILLSVHKSLHTYDPNRPCMSWLAAIMHYRLTDWLRSHYRAQERPLIHLEEVEFFLQADVTTNPLEYEHIHKALEQLPEKQRRVIQAMYFEELSVVETAQKLGMGLSAVKVTAHRAYKKLRPLINAMEAV